MNEFIVTLSIWILPVLFAITLHEAAHGYIAYVLGDDTAKQLGRVSINPIKHIDPIGTVALPLFIFTSTHLLAGSGMLFGWAKPVPVNWMRLGIPRRDMALVALAGPAANLIMAIIWTLLLKLGVNLATDMPLVSAPMIEMAQAGILINAILMIFNLIPILPLDGGRILTSLLPRNQAIAFSRLERYGLVIVIVLMLSGLLGQFILPLVNQFAQLCLTLVSLA